MRRYWVQSSQIQNNDHDEAIVTFTGDLFHHIFDVCRQEVGQHFEILTDESKAFLVEVITVEKKQARAKILEDRVIESLPRPYVHLALSIPRYAVMDSIIERAVELGVSSILPFYSDYSFIRKASNLPEGKKERWQKIVVSATQQSGRGELMKIEDPKTWSEMLQNINPNAENWCLFAYEGSAVLGLQDYLKSKKKTLTTPPENIWVIVGSEGGFSAEEVNQMHQLGLDPVTLGSQILRVETACLTLVSVLKYEFELFK